MRAELHARVLNTMKMEERMTPAPNFHMFQSGAMSRLWSTLGSACVAIYNDGCLGIAKGVAYSALLAFFPVLTTLATILVLARAEAVSRTVARLLYDVVPAGTEDVVRTLFVVHGQRPNWLLVLAILLAVWAASGAVMSMMEGFHAVYRIPAGRPFVKERLIAMLLVFSSALPVLGASALIVFGRRAEQAVIEWIGVKGVNDLTGWVLLTGQILRFGVAFGSIVLATALLYWVGPNRKQRFRQGFPGAVVATVLWLLATLVFSWYVRHISNYNVLYGSVGAGLALLVWLYLLAVIVLLGCEFNAAREKLDSPAGN
jgi:membrane protein